MGTLAGGVAHEFNNINNTVSTYTQLALEQPDLPEKIRGYLARIRRAAGRSRDLTQNLMRFCGMRSIRPEEADLVEAVRRALEIVESEMRDEGVELTARLDPVPPLTLAAPEITQVVVNLLLNAVHAVTGSAERHITVETDKEGDEAVVRVADTGMGISEDVQQKLFTPFYTTKGPMASAGSPLGAISGSGLGLAVAHAIVERHGGGLDFESEPDQGAVFTVRLPIANGAGQASQPPEGAGQMQAENPAASRAGNDGQNGAPTLLVLDDEEDARDSLRDYFQMKGFEVIATEDGREGLEAVRRGGVDLVLLDLKMPIMGGETFLNRLHGFDEEKQPPVLIMTGREEEKVLESEAARALARGREIKPLDLPRLAEHVNHILAASR
jgi:CheY-like chemotaxis protein